MQLTVFFRLFTNLTILLSFISFLQYILHIDAIKNLAGIGLLPTFLLRRYDGFHIRKWTEEKTNLFGEKAQQDEDSN